MRLTVRFHRQVFRQRLSVTRRDILTRGIVQVKAEMLVGGRHRHTIRGFLSKIPLGYDLMRDQPVPLDRFFTTATGTTRRANNRSIDAPKFTVHLANVDER